MTSRKSLSPPPGLRLSLTLLTGLLLASTVGCGLTSPQREVDYYKQQLQLSEDRGRRMELELADLERRSQQWSIENASAREELAAMRRELANLEAEAATPEDLGETVAIVPAATPDDLDLLELAEIDGVEVSRGVDDEIRLTLQDQILFPAGSVKIRKDGEQAILRIAETRGTRFGGCEIRIEGHTDSTPPRRVRDRYPTNWELSTARACVVLRELLDSGVVDPTSVVATGYGDQRPIDTNETKEGRSRNRRVEVIVLDN